MKRICKTFSQLEAERVADVAPSASSLVEAETSSSSSNAELEPNELPLVVLLAIKVGLVPNCEFAVEGDAVCIDPPGFPKPSPELPGGKIWGEFPKVLPATELLLNPTGFAAEGPRGGFVVVFAELLALFQPPAGNVLPLFMALPPGSILPEPGGKTELLPEAMLVGEELLLAEMADGFVEPLFP